jgi:hypothetical protein
MVSDLISEMKCKNCKNYYNGYCNLESNKERAKVKDTDTCFNGLFEEGGQCSDLRVCYDRIVEVLKYYSDLNPNYYNLVALWILGSYVNENFEVFPYLFINAMRGSGKTRLLKLITSMAREGQLMASMTEAVLFRTIGTLAIDEFENLGSKDKNELRELLNAAYKKGITVTRMRKKKVLDGETQEAERFSVYRPIVMANIWGMEEVLGDRCIHLQLEKSSNPIITRLVENFNENPDIKFVQSYLSQNQCSLCSVVSPENIYTTWNNYIYSLSSVYTLTTHTTPETLNTLTANDEKDEKLLELFGKIYNTDIDGRNLELFFPLFLIAGQLGEDILDQTLDHAKNMVHEKRIDEIMESKDILVYKMVSNLVVNQYYRTNELVAMFRFMIESDEKMEWLNAKWMGRALKRLQLTVDRRRVAEGIEVTLNINKAKNKMDMFMKEGQK